VFDPQTPDTLYRFNYLEIDKSSNGGASWQQLVSLDPINDPPVSHLVIDPTAPDILYFTTGTRGVPAAPSVGLSAQVLENQLFKSVDGGGTWTAQPLPRITDYIISLGIDPQNSKTLYLAAGNNGVLKSTDGGATWAPIPGSGALHIERVLV